MSQGHKKNKNFMCDFVNLKKKVRNLPVNRLNAIK